MSSSGALYEQDPDAWHAHLAQGNATQPRKRVSADVIIRNTAGQILLVDPHYKPAWDLPGGMAEANEPPAEAARREIAEELRLHLQIGNLLCIDWVSPHGPWDDLLNFIFDGGILDEDETMHLKLGDNELRAHEFCDQAQAQLRLHPHVWRRLAAALETLTTGRVCYLHDGNPTISPHPR